MQQQHRYNYAAAFRLRRRIVQGSLTAGAERNVYAEHARAYRRYLARGGVREDPEKRIDPAP